MAPATITDDYYLVLEVEQKASLDLITRSYKRLALKLHPDRNMKADTTVAFQLLSRAYETLKDIDQRRDYDRLYPCLRKTQTPGKSAAPGPPPTSYSEAAQIAALEKSRSERNARWWSTKKIHDSAILKAEEAIRQSEREINNLEKIAAAEIAQEAQKSSWTTWLLSPMHNQAEESEEVKSRKDRAKQERRIEKDMKERRLARTRKDLNEKKSILEQEKQKVMTANQIEDTKIERLRTIIEAREARERVNRERERMMEQARQRQEQERRDREAAEILRRQRAEQEKRDREAAEALRRQLEQEWARFTESWEHLFEPEREGMREAQQQREQRSQAPRPERRNGQWSSCSHGGWWPKVQGRTPCPQCAEIWTYLLECPQCQLQACPKCQHVLRPRRRRY